MGFTTSSELSLRDEPATTGFELTVMPKGACVMVFCKTFGEEIRGNSLWDSVSYDGYSGWAADQYINTGQGPGSAQQAIPYC